MCLLTKAATSIVYGGSTKDPVGCCFKGLHTDIFCLLFFPFTQSDDMMAA